MRRAAKVYADFGPLLAFVYLYDAAFKALEGAFNNHNAVVFVKANKRRADFWPQTHKMLNNLQIVVSQGNNISIAVQKVVKIRKLFKGRQSQRINFAGSFYYYIRRKKRLQLSQKLSLPPYGKLPCKINKPVLFFQLRRMLLQTLHKKSLPPRRHLNYVVLH